MLRRSLSNPCTQACISSASGVVTSTNALWRIPRPKPPENHGRLSGSSPPSSNSHPLHRSAASHASSATRKRQLNSVTSHLLTQKAHRVMVTKNAYQPLRVRINESIRNTSVSLIIGAPRPGKTSRNGHIRRKIERRIQPRIHTIANHPPANDDVIVASE